MKRGATSVMFKEALPHIPMRRKLWSFPSRIATEIIGVVRFRRGGIDLIIGKPVKMGFQLIAASSLSISNSRSEWPLWDNRTGYVSLLKGALAKTSGLRECIVTIPEEESIYKIVTVAKNKRLEDMLIDVREGLPIDISDIVLAYEEIRPLAGSPDHSDYAFWATSKKYLTACRDILSSAGLALRDFFPEELGLVELIFPSRESRDANLIFTVSESRSLFTIFAGRAIHFSGVLPFGTSKLSAESPETDRFIAEILQATLYYKNRVFHEHGASHHVNRILVLGAIPEYLAKLIALRTYLRVERLDAWSGLVPGSEDGAMALKIKPPEFIPLLGVMKYYGRI